MLQVSHAILFLCFRIIDKDDKQTVRLAEDEGGAPVKVCYPYEQLKPYVIPFARLGPSSGDRLDFFDDLHISLTTAVAAEPVPLETIPAPSISLSTGVAVAAESTPPPVISLLSDVTADSIPLSTDVAGADSIPVPVAVDVAADSILLADTIPVPVAISLSPDAAVDVAADSILLSTDAAVADSIAIPAAVPFSTDVAVDVAPDSISLSTDTESIPKRRFSLKKRHPCGKLEADTVSHDMKRLKCEGDDVVCTGEEPAPVRGPDPLVVTKQSVPVTNSLILSNNIGELQKKSVWLGDDHIDHCQGLLLKQFPGTKGLQGGGGWVSLPRGPPWATS